MINTRSVLSLVLSFSVAFAGIVDLVWANLTPGVQELVDFETKANMVSYRSNREVLIQHYEIPLRLLEKSFSANLDEQTKRALIFEKDGEPFVRWVINPEDTKWHKEVETWLAKKGISAEKRVYFKGYQTASRSYIVQDPETNAEFSIKVSTDKTGGNWRDKKQSWADAKDVRTMDDFVNKIFEKQAPQNFIYMNEPAAFGIAEIDQGMIIRSLKDLPKTSKKYYMPGFSAVHEEEGKWVAQMNGAKDPAAFWNENYNKPLARTLAELMAKTGVNYDSPHSQNFLIELDEKFRPTGKIVIRDLGDVYLNKEFFVAVNRTDIVKQWEVGNVISGQFNNYIGVLHGNQKPSWVSEKTYAQWGMDYFDAFAEELSLRTNVPVSQIKGPVTRSGDYFSMPIRSNSKDWQSFLSDLSAGHVRTSTPLCRGLF